MKRIIDASVHNPRQAEVWERFRQGDPIRPPVIVGTNARYYMDIPEVNVNGISFKEYTEDPAVMLDFQCRCEALYRSAASTSAPLHTG